MDGTQSNNKTKEDSMQPGIINANPPPRRANSTNGMQSSRIVFVLGAALLGALAGCVGDQGGPSHARVHARPPPGYVGGQAVVQDDYVYYPGYQVYYASNRRQYVYLEGSSWVTRPAPPRVSVDVLVASPSVRLDFHDSPAVHHTTVVRQYPKHWAPPTSHPNHGGGDRDNGHDQGSHR
jgi:hypothetical protein